MDGSKRAAAAPVVGRVLQPGDVRTEPGERVRVRPVPDGTVQSDTTGGIWDWYGARLILERSDRVRKPRRPGAGPLDSPGRAFRIRDSRWKMHVFAVAGAVQRGCAVAVALVKPDAGTTQGSQTTVSQFTSVDVHHLLCHKGQEPSHGGVRGAGSVMQGCVSNGITDVLSTPIRTTNGEQEPVVYDPGQAGGPRAAG